MNDNTDRIVTTYSTHGAGRANRSNPKQKIDRLNRKAWTNIRYTKGEQIEHIAKI